MKPTHLAASSFDIHKSRIRKVKIFCISNFFFTKDSKINLLNIFFWFLFTGPTYNFVWPWVSTKHIFVIFYIFTQLNITCLFLKTRFLSESLCKFAHLNPRSVLWRKLVYWNNSLYYSLLLSNPLYLNLSKIRGRMS